MEQNNGTMFKWPEWASVAAVTTDLSIGSIDGRIPLECPKKLLYGSKPCSSKLYDTGKKRRLKGRPQREVRCSLCDYHDWRLVGKLE